MKSLIKKIIRKIREGYLLEMWEEWKWISAHFRLYWKGIAFFLFAGIVSTAMSLGAAVASKYLIDAVTGIKKDKIAICVLLTVGLAIGSAIITNLIGIVKVKIRTGVQNDMQDKCYSIILNGDYLALQKYRDGDLLNRLNYDTQALSSGILDFIPNIINQSISFIGALIIMLYYDVTMAFIALVGAPIMAVMGYGAMKKIREYSKQMMKVESDKMSFSQDSISNMQTIKAFGIQKHFKSEMLKWLTKHRNITIDNNKFIVRYQNIMAVVGILITYSCYLWGVYRLWGGFITFGTMTLFIELAGRVRNGFSSLVSVVPGMISTASHAGRIMEIEALENEGVSDDIEQPVYIPKCVTFENIAFSYITDEVVLKESSFKVRCGETVAFIGPSGEGKTTIIRLLLSLIKQNDGRAYITDENGIEHDLSTLTKSLFSYVPQGNTLFAGTIRYNLSIVNENATDDEMWRALEMADARDFIEKLPGGLDYMLGEHGKGLSEGQAQRISIARAVIRNTPIMLMDEATSALDPWTEKKVLDHIMKADGNKIIIVTAHRKSVMDLCDKIYRVGNETITKIERS